LDYRNHPGDWTGITPSAAEYSAKTSITTSKVSEIEPNDRAWPQFAVHKGLVYLARNTTDGPQLWRCDPAVQGAPAPATAADCDADDWTLIVFRSDATMISASSDFEGGAGCTAPCAGIAGNGFGTPATNVAFFDAKSLNFAGTDFL